MATRPSRLRACSQGLIALALLASVLIPAAAAAAPTASPLAGPCAPGASYDPACDVDHDGDVDIFDIQLSAGHWGQAGTWLGDNNHNHLGQTWTGTNNPLKIEGTFGSPDYASLVLSNNSGGGSGLHILSAGGAGVRVTSARYGVVVNSVDENGVYVGSAGLEGVYVSSADLDGVRVNSAGYDGVRVNSAGSTGVRVSSAGLDGVVVNSAGFDGVYVYSAGYNGVEVNSAGDDGAKIGLAGTPSTSTTSPRSNGFEVAGAEGDGLFVGRADVLGVEINSVGLDAFYAAGVGRHGLHVTQATQHGVRVAAAGIDGVNVTGSQYAGNFAGNINVTGNCIGCLQANFAVNAGDRPLQPGDVVSVLAVTSTDFDTGRALWQVVLAQPGQGVVGVVAGRAELVSQEERRPNETGQRLVPRDGPAQPGGYVTVVYNGPMPVKVAVGDSTIAAGTRLTVAGDGTVRPLQTRTVDGMVVTEGAPVIGVALEAPKDGMVWVLVNPQ